MMSVKKVNHVDHGPKGAGVVSLSRRKMGLTECPENEFSIHPDRSLLILPFKGVRFTQKSIVDNHIAVRNITISPTI
ncbi:hypothetical protein DMENIID0001_019640 [Sergentomyia squamirostris]